MDLSSQTLKCRKNGEGTRVGSRWNYRAARDSASITVRNFISRENKADHVDGLMKRFIEFNFSFLSAPIVGD